MKTEVLEDTPTRLTMRFRPVWRWMIWLLGLPCLVFGLLVLLSVADATRLTCDRTQDLCVIEQTGLLVSERKTVRLGDVRGAELTPEEFVLRTADGAGVPVLTYIKPDEGEMKDFVARVGAFVEDQSEARLEIVHRNFFSVLMPGGIMALLGVYLVGWIGKVVTCVFDKKHGFMKVKRGFGFGISWTTERPISEIDSVQVEERRSPRSSPTYATRIRLRSGRRITIASFSSRGDGETIAGRIRRFIQTSPAPDFDDELEMLKQLEQQH